MSKKIVFITLLLFYSIFLYSQNIDTSFVNIRNRVAFEYYELLNQKETNQVIAPFFLDFSFLELYLATKGGTSNQIKDYLLFDKDRDVQLKNMIEYQKIVSENKSLNTNFIYSLDFFIEDSLKILDKYKKTISPLIVDSVKNIDFTQDKNVIASLLNKEIAANNLNYFTEYLKKENIPDSPNILINTASYYSGYWAKDFENIFYSSFKPEEVEKEIENVKYFTSYDYYKYGEAETYQIIELPYEGFQFSLIMIIPKSFETLNDFEKIFNLGSYKLWRQKNMQTQRVRVLVPDFEIESFYDYKNKVDTIMTAIFTKRGNFLNLIKKIVNVSGIYHYVKFQFNSENYDLKELKTIDIETEKEENESFVFYANRPFIFMLIHKETQSIIYMGRIYTLK